MKIEGQIVDIIGREIFPGSVEFEGNTIIAVNRHETVSQQYIMPGFVDAHNHIESSMLPPYEYARMALRHGTIATNTILVETGLVRREDFEAVARTALNDGAILVNPAEADYDEIIDLLEEVWA